MILWILLFCMIRFDLMFMVNIGMLGLSVDKKLDKLLILVGWNNILYGLLICIYVKLVKLWFGVKCLWMVGSMLIMVGFVFFVLLLDIVKFLCY